MIKEAIVKIVNKGDLSYDEAYAVMNEIMSGETTPTQNAAFLAALSTKSARAETTDEIAGCAAAMRDHATKVDTGMDIFEIVGTGGDNAHSFNISTTSALVAAAGGMKVAKHGNRAASSRCGSADVLNALGCNLDAPPSVIEYAISEHGIGFLYAQKLHPVLANVAVIRRELRIRTIFNMLGPLCNPAGARSIVLGVYAPEMTELFAGALLELGVRRAMVVHGLDGLDEISCCAATRVSELRDGRIVTRELLPELLLGAVYAPEELRGGDPERNAEILRSVLSGVDRGAPRAAVLLNAGAAIYVAGVASTLEEGILLAGRSIDSGAAERKLELLIEASHGTGA